MSEWKAHYVENSELVKKLDSNKYFEIFKALDFLSSQKRTGFQLSDEVKAKLMQLFDFHYHDSKEPEKNELEEALRREAILIFGLYFQDQSSLDDLVKVIKENKNSDFVLSAVVSGVSSLGTYPYLKNRVLNELANISLDSKYSESLKSLAYIHILHLLHRINPAEYAQGLDGKLKHALDLTLLKSLTS